MLKRIDPLLNADLLHTLRAMGHGDDLVLADANFPATSLSRTTAIEVPIRIDSPLARAAEAILSLMPVDREAEDAIGMMAAPNGEPDVQAEVRSVIEMAEGRTVAVTPLDRFAFYDRARAAYAIVLTAERRFFGCVALRKGAVGPDVDLGPWTERG